MIVSGGGGEGFSCCVCVLMDLSEIEFVKRSKN